MRVWPLPTCSWQCELVIPPPILEWLGDAVLESDRTEQAARERVVEAMQSALEAWLSYRDEVAISCGLTRPQPRSSPPRPSGVWSSSSIRDGK